MCCDCGVDAVGRVSRVAWHAQQPTRIATAGRQPDFRKLHAAKGSCFSRRDALRARAVLQGRRECRPAACGDRKSVVSGQSVSVRVDLGGRRIIKKKKTTKNKT